MDLNIEEKFKKQKYINKDIVESGANLPKAKREKQVMNYLKKKYDKKGYI